MSIIIDRILKLTISIIFYFGYRTVRIAFRLFKKHFPATLVILMYHSVKVHQCNSFKRQMDFLKNAGHPTDLNSIPVALIPDKNYIAVTFDDGFVSFIQNALPELLQRQIPVALFIPTGSMNKKPGWVSSPEHEYADEMVLTEDDLRKLPQEFVTIGSHSVNHPHLNDISKEDTIKELKDSKEKLEHILQKEVTLFSLPYGSVNNEILKLSKKIGYKKVFHNIPTFPATNNSKYMIGRIDISADDWQIEYRLKMLGAYQWQPLASAIKRVILRKHQ